MWRIEGTTDTDRSAGRGQLQAHAGVDLIPREVVRLADGLHLRPWILPDRGVLYRYPPERISRRNGVVDGLRLSPCHATHVEGHGEGGGNEQGSEPATAIFRAVPSHRGNIRDDCSVPNGIFSVPPRAGRPPDRKEAMRRDHTPVVWLATEGKDPQVFTLSLLVAPQQIESGTARLDAWEDRALLRHRLKCSSLAVQLEDFGYRV